jgi:hypothetical protein
MQRSTGTAFAAQANTSKKRKPQMLVSKETAYDGALAKERRSLPFEDIPAWHGMAWHGLPIKTRRK